MINPISLKTSQMIKDCLSKIEEVYDADCLYVNGPIESGILNYARELIEILNTDSKKGKLCVILTTNGGDAITVERLVNIFRHYYSEVDFIIPDHAYSAGTILCMSGDNIYMDFNSVLGPIDPQVQNKDGRFVPALGYLEKINALLDKAQNENISQAEFLILKDFDLAEISLYEQAVDLTEVLLVDWLAKYKFKNWDVHSGTKNPVEQSEKEIRAREIAQALSDYDRWKSHGRPLNIDVLRKLKLQIEDFGEKADVQNLILDCHNLCEDYMHLEGVGAFICTRRSF